MRVFEPPEPNSHAKVIEFRRRSHRHPSMQPFDQDDAAASECVVLTKLEAKLIVGVLRHARGHCPSPAALNDAITILGGTP